MKPEYEWLADNCCNQALRVLTTINTGHAGLEHEDMAPLFAAAPDNCFFETVWENSSEQEVLGNLLRRRYAEVVFF